MAKWSGASRSGGGEGILRGAASATKEREELLVFGYSCKLFRDDERAREVDQGRLLIPWNGDETLRIDRYDARGALHELASLEAPPGGHDWRLELTDAERRVEQLCDEERYRALYCDEEEELMYKEEELKRLRAAGYGQIGFNYDTQENLAEATPTDTSETDEPFIPTTQLQTLLTPDLPLPDTQKLYAIIEKTATFIARHGTQMEILLRAKQAGNTQFDFLDKECPLHQFYRVVLDAVRNDTLHAKTPVEVIPEDHNEDYLHPALAAPIVESAPSIPSIHYKPSADCDYTMLISRIKGTHEEDPPEPAVPAGELAPPGTQPLALPAAGYDPAHAQIAKAPVLYAVQGKQEEQVYTQPLPAEPLPIPIAAPAPPVVPSAPSVPAAPVSNPKSTALNLMHYYNSGSETDQSDEEDNNEQVIKKEEQINKEEVVKKELPVEIEPPSDVREIIDKMAAYVARNGDEFEDIVKTRNDSRFTFLQPEHQYHLYYKRLMLQKRGVTVPPATTGTEKPSRKKETEGKSEKDDKKKTIAPVSFSIKKLKEPDAILPKPALPYESSDEEKDNDENNDDAKSETKSEIKPSEPIKQVLVIQDVPINPVSIAVIKPLEILAKDTIAKIETKDKVHVVDKANDKTKTKFVTPVENVKVSEEKIRERADKKRKKEKRKRENGESKKSKRDRSRSYDNKEKTKEKRSKSEEKRSRSRDKRERSRSRNKSLSRERDKISKKEKKERHRKESKEEEKVEIMNEDGEDILIDLTGELSDGKDGENGDRTKQSERKRRAAAFLASRAKDTPVPSVIQDNTLAGAMVKTLVELQAKKEAEEEKQRRRERRERKRSKQDESSDRERERSHRKSKRRKHRSSSEGEDNYESSSKRRKRRKDKKRSKSKKHKHSRESDADSDCLGSTKSKKSEDSDINSNKEGKVDFDPEEIKSKLKKLREESDDEVMKWGRESSEKEKEVKTKKEYSEGECESSEDKTSSSASETE